MKLPLFVSVVALAVSLIALAIVIVPSIAVRHRAQLPKAKVVTLEYPCISLRNAVGYWGPGICPY